MKDLPANLEAERAVLGAMLLEPASGEVPLDILRPSSFYSPRHGNIFRAIARLATEGKPHDVIAVADYMDAHGTLDDSGGRSYLSGLLSAVTTVASVEYHAEVVREKALLRGLVRAGQKIVELGMDEAQSAEKQIDRAVELLGAAGQDPARLHVYDIGEAVASWEENMEELRRGEVGITVGYPSLDKYVRGGAGQVLVVAGLPGLGKTAFGLNMIWHQARAGIKTAVVSLEMTKEAVAERLLQIEGNATADELQYNPARTRGYIEALSKRPIKVHPMAARSAGRIVRQMRLLRQRGVRSFFVDYLQLMQIPESERRDIEIGEALRMLLEFAKNTDACVITGSQVNRAAISQTGVSKPKMWNMKESGAIEAHADIIIGLSRPSYTNALDDEPVLYAEVLKNRKRGFVGAQLTFHFEIARQRIEEHAFSF